MTDRYGVIGHPISHSKSPVIHQVFARQTGQDMIYEAFDLEPAGLAEGLNGLVAAGVRGLNVTVPHKLACVALLDEISPRARLAGAVNTLVFHADGGRTGDNTDGVGLVRDLVGNLGIRLEDQRLLILGAGGAARGIIPALLEQSPASLCIANRTVGRARELAAEFGGAGKLGSCSFEALSGQRFDLVINATSAGLHGELPPFPDSLAGGKTCCYDLSYAQQHTPFTRWAAALGAGAVHQGWGMLVEQAAESFLLWRGVRPDTAPLLQQLTGWRQSARAGEA
ncbi:MAG: shikimate dehydrogenase [Chromatiales bacterium]|nr:shikimate dehydrogenase [Chromatiales bacterium]